MSNSKMKLRNDSQRKCNENEIEKNDFKFMPHNEDR